MASQATQSLDKKYKRILSQERAWAYALAASLKKPRPISVWEVVMPILLIFTYAARKVGRETFVQNTLFTKKLALDAARDMVKKHRGREAVMAPIEKKTQDLLSSVEEGVYSEVIRERQLEEIDFLIDHYCRLLKAEGDDYDSLVRDAYPVRGEYLDFVERLKSAEREVNVASLQTVGSRGDPAFVAQLEQTTDRIRTEFVKRIFGESS
jgi:hypothetical protein